jgi:hypothetical protein
LAGRYRQRLRGLDALAASMIRIDAMWMWALLVPVKKPVSVCLVWVTQNTLRCPPSEWSTVRHHCGTVSAIAWNTQPSIEPRGAAQRRSEAGDGPARTGQNQGQVTRGGPDQ